MAPRRLSRLVALLRYHRPRQFAWRLYRTVQRHLRRRLPERLVFQAGQSQARWKPGARSAFQRIAARRLLLWPERNAQAADIVAGQFRFLHQTRDLRIETAGDEPEMDWNPAAPRLWRFHLQCQEYLTDLADQQGADAAYNIVRSWLGQPRHQGPTRDPDAWHPFCISRRLPVWLSLAAAHEPPAAIAGQFWRSVADQVLWLRRNCEWDLGGNHLLENLTALSLAESYLDLGAAAGGTSVQPRLLAELDEQILPSGEHYERAPTYHALMMVSVLQCAEAARFAQSSVLDPLRIVISQMFQFAQWIRQPDGHFPLLADSARGETPDLDKLFEWAEAFWDPDARGNPTADYWATQTDRGDRLLFDVGPLGCDHLPAHAHADLLQITATLGGRDAIVDTGNFDYEPGQLRQRCRRTSAHNVLQLGSREQCDIWSSFRMGRRGKVIWQHRGTTDGYSWCAAAHDGFGCPVGRIVVWSGSAWTVLDWFDGDPGPVDAASRLHWHPDWRLAPGPGRSIVTAFHPDAPELIYTVKRLGESANLSIEVSLYCPDFGQQIANQVIVNVQRCGSNDSAGWLGFHLSLPAEPTSPVPRVHLDGGCLNVSLPDGGAISLSAEGGHQVG
ncbi:Heparinase II/III-like protein [Stieleria neptunia]|uniref:Heparinase II/III-like protein n=1 Tax=Stieleria neptunia TaxID=2527979 RepID=A0A518HTL4_9BACT|nr:heparinase II/III family protein [Stieleria neptunia]QDV44195.1 Heparinase II/III-like protein [Stieleria neptunia]